MQCPQCGQMNLAAAQFCKNCGKVLASGQTPPVPPAQGPNPPGSAAAPTAPVGPQQSPSFTPPPYGAPPPPPGGQPWGAAYQPPQPPYQQPYQQPYGAPPVPGMGSTGYSPFNIWGPFAGYGTRGRHVAWLLGAMGDRADILRNAIGVRFAARAIADAVVSDKVLVGRGVAVEQRPYFLIQRKIATSGLYIARLGDDIYISQVTYARGPISFVRIALLAVMLLFQFFFLVGGFGSMLDSFSGSSMLFGGGPDLGGMAFFLCCVGPLGLVNTAALLFAGLFTAWRTVTDKDPLAILRTSLNEFNQDDVIALEKAVEETVRECMDQVGIDRRLLPPASDYGMRPRLI